MSCDLQDATKSVEICINDTDAVYRYGTKGRDPELEIITPVATVDYLPWPGIGRDIWESVTFANGQYRYEVGTGFSRPIEDGEATPAATYGGITITNDGTEIVYLRCDVGSVDWAYGGGLFNAKRAQNLCWQPHPITAWQTCPND